jgi:hypothetical protein
MSLQEYGWRITDKKASETWSQGEYQILSEGSGTGTFAKDNSQAALTYLCEYYNVEQFLDCVLGKTVKVGSALRRSASAPNWDEANGSLPEAHPYFDNFYAATAELDTRGTSQQMPYGPLWKKAHITVYFRPPPFNVLADTATLTNGEVDRFVSSVNEGQAEFQTTLGYFAFVNNSDPQDRRVLDIPPAFVIVAERYQYTWHQIPAADRADGQPDLKKVPNRTTIQGLVGKLNSVAFDGFAPGTVLFSGYTPKLTMPQVTTAGNYYYDITYTLGVRDYGTTTTPLVTDEKAGWNYAYDPTQQKWRLYTNTGTTAGKPMYEYADLNSLFSVTW